MEMYSTEIKDKITNLSHENYKLKSLLRILIKCLQAPENLKTYDMEILAGIINEKQILLSEDLNWLNLKFEI